MIPEEHDVRGDEMVGWAAAGDGKNVIERRFCTPGAKFAGSGECRSVRLVVLVRGRLSGSTGLVRTGGPAWSPMAEPGAQRLSGKVRGIAGGGVAGSAVVPPRPNIAIPASPPAQQAHSMISVHKWGGGSVHTGRLVAEWLACWTQAQNGPGSSRSRDAVG